jgi:DNA polymerase III epsilon subunit-like protein
LNSVIWHSFMHLSHLEEKMKIQQFYPIQHDSKVALVFDVETTGLLGHTQSMYSKLDEIPYVVQLSYAMYDLTYGRLLKTVDSYIRIAEHIQIPPDATEINGIDQELCQREGYPMVNVLHHFYDDYHMSSLIVAHNYKFDSRMMTFEFQRHWEELKITHPYALNLFHPTYMKHNGMKWVCTMMESIHVCRIPHPSSVQRKTPVQIKLPSPPSSPPSSSPPSSSPPSSSPPSSSPPSSSPPSSPEKHSVRRSLRNQSRALSPTNSISSESVISYGSVIETVPIVPPSIPQITVTVPTFDTDTAAAKKTEKKVSYKWPKLSELYSYYFGDPPSGLHDSMVDVLVTMRCYLRLMQSQTVDDEQFGQWCTLVRK